MNFEKEKTREAARFEKAQQKKELYDLRSKTHEIKKSVRWFKLPTTTKLLIAYIFIDCTVVQVYSMVAMWHFGDLSALLYLIPAVVTEGISFAVYCAKSYHETKQEENVKLEREKLQIEQDSEPTREGAMG